MPERISRPKKRSKTRAANGKAAVQSANAYIVRHYPIGCLGGPPRRLTLGSRQLLIVPLILTSPGYGAVGEVGVLALDAETHPVVGGTPRREVGKAVAHLREERHDALQAAFHRARKT
jgi:hypothetical protein